MVTIELDGNSLSIETLHAIMFDHTKISISGSTRIRVNKSRETINEFVNAEKVVYGVTTGFGSLKDKFINKDDVSTLQVNLIKSHSVGVGEPISIPLTRGMLALRINTLVKGYSGVRMELIEYLVNVFNLGIFSKVPSQGSVGASGDLAPLSHLFVGYLGEGELYDPKLEKFTDAAAVLNSYHIPLMVLDAKEGLALNNGTPFMTVHLADAVYRCERLLKNATVVSALTLEALRGTHRAFHSGIHEVRGHDGQIRIAAEMRDLLSDSNSHEVHGMNKVQDAYSLRCIPQVHGPVLETLEFAKNIVTKEMNAATDNPLIIEGDVVSGGNFHGQYLASAADYLSIAITTLGNISERRKERLVNSDLSKLNGFLVDKVENLGLESGFMITQYTAAALAAENRTLSNPGSVHTIPTCQNSEDHVSMGAFAVRKLLSIVANTEKIVALELLAAVQAKEFTKETTSPKLETVMKTVRARVPHLHHDRFMGPDIAAVIDIVTQGSLI